MVLLPKKSTLDQKKKSTIFWSEQNKECTAQNETTHNLGISGKSLFLTPIYFTV